MTTKAIISKIREVEARQSRASSITQWAQDEKALDKLRAKLAEAKQRERD